MVTMAQSNTRHAVLVALHGDILLPQDQEHVTEAETVPAIVQRVYPLVAPICLIGRSREKCHIYVLNRRIDISRVHACITRQDSRYILEDNNSKHGTFVNGQRIQSARELVAGDIIGFANTREMLRFEDPTQGGPPLVEPLTERELEVLCHVALGRSNQEIANRLCIGVETVRSHLKQIYQKLSVSNRTEAIHAARRQGLL